MSTRALSTSRIMSVINGSPQYQESISATTTPTWRNATAFSPGDIIMLQADQDFYVRGGTVTGTVASTNGVKVLADEKYVMILKDGDRLYSEKETHVCCVGATATATIKVFKLQ
jgi:hypothetical protein